MYSLTYHSFLFSFILYQASTAVILAQDGQEASSVDRLSAKYSLLIRRQNIVYCAATDYATYCVNSFCCFYGCIPSSAMCCSNGQYCPEGTACEIVYGQMTCQCVGLNCGIGSTPSSSAALTSAATSTTPAPQPTVSTTSTPTSTPTPSQDPSPSSTSTPGAGNTKNGSGLSSGTLAGIGSIAGIISCADAIWGCMRWRKHQHS